MHHEGRKHPLARVIFELIFDQPMHPTWKLRRLCANEDCRQPHHHRVELVYRVNEIAEPLPGRVWVPRDIAVQDLPNAPEEVIDTVLMYEGGRDMTPEQLVERSKGFATADEFAIALERIHTEGL